MRIRIYIGSECNIILSVEIISTTVRFPACSKADEGEEARTTVR